MGSSNAQSFCLLYIFSLSVDPPESLSTQARTNTHHLNILLKINVGRHTLHSRDLRSVPTLRRARPLPIGGRGE